MTLICVHCYPWYSYRRSHEVAPAFRPAIGYYPSLSDVVIRWQVQQLQTAEVDFVVIEALSPSDWAAEEAYQATDRMIPRVKNVPH